MKSNWNATKLNYISENGHKYMCRNYIIYDS